MSTNETQRHERSGSIVNGSDGENSLQCPSCGNTDTARMRAFPWDASERGDGQQTGRHCLDCRFFNHRDQFVRAAGQTTDGVTYEGP